MGCCNCSNVNKTGHFNPQSITNQIYCSNIMLLCFSTLEAICLKILKRNAKPIRKMFGLYDKVDFSQKSIPELERQLQIMLTLFKFSKKEIQNNEKQGFSFPKTFSIQTAIGQINTFQKICQNHSQTSYHFCNDFKAILYKSYQLLSFETAKLEADEEKVQMVSNIDFLKNSIDAANHMNCLSKENELQILQPSSLAVKLQKINFDYNTLTVIQ